MADETSSAVARKPTQSPYQLDKSQTTQACKVLLKHISDERERRGEDKPNLLAADEDADEAQPDDEQTPIWLILTTKKHIVDQTRLKPNKIQIPHAIHTSPHTTICLITADPQNAYTSIVADPSFPEHLRKRITKVISITNLKKQFSTFEARRSLLASHDLFLADDRIVTYLPSLLGKTFYKGGTKRPIPIKLSAGHERGEDGKRVKLDPASGKAQKTNKKDESKSQSSAKPDAAGREVEKALRSTVVLLASGTSTAVKVARAGMTTEQINENVEFVTNAMVERFVTNKWRNVRAVHIKGPETMAFPVWMASELWEDEGDVLEEKPKFGKKEKAGKKLQGAAEEGQKALPAAEGEGRKRKAEDAKKPDAANHAKKKRKVELDAKMAAESISRKESLKKQKADTLAAVS